MIRKEHTKCIYHIVSGKITGNLLYPLSKIKNIHPNTYKKLMKKYKGRERILSMWISPFNCTWSDVLHLSAVHPNKIIETLAKFNIRKKFKYYEIDPTTLVQKNFLVYTNEERSKDKMYEPETKDFKKFNISKIDKWSSIPESTINHYKKRIAEGRDVLVFSRIPHILYKGSIDVSKLNIASTNLLN